MTFEFPLRREEGVPLNTGFAPSLVHLAAESPSGTRHLILPSYRARVTSYGQSAQGRHLSSCHLQPHHLVGAESDSRFFAVVQRHMVSRLSFFFLDEDAHVLRTRSIAACRSGRGTHEKASGAIYHLIIAIVTNVDILTSQLAPSHTNLRRQNLTV